MGQIHKRVKTAVAGIVLAAALLTPGVASAGVIAEYAKVGVSAYVEIPDHTFADAQQDTWVSATGGVPYLQDVNAEVHEAGVGFAISSIEANWSSASAGSVDIFMSGGLNDWVEGEVKNNFASVDQWLYNFLVDEDSYFNLSYDLRTSDYGGFYLIYLDGELTGPALHTPFAGSATGSFQYFLKGGVRHTVSIDAGEGKLLTARLPDPVRYSSYGNFDFLISEVGAGAAVPEPTTWLMMIVGFGAIGGAMRSSRKHVRRGNIGASIPANPARIVRGVARAARRYLLLPAMACVSATAWPAHAAIVDPNIGLLYLEALTRVTTGPVGTLEEDYDLDQDFFIGTPITLSASVLANTQRKTASSLLSVAAQASWTSPDHGSVGFSSLSRLILEESLFHREGEYALNLIDSAELGSARMPFWQYNFTPTVNAALSMTFDFASSGGGTAHGERPYFFIEIDGNRQSPPVDSFFSDFQHTFLLTAGQNYTIGLEPMMGYALTDYDGSAALDSFWTTSLNMTFDIVAAAPVDPDPSGAVPEPATWLMMIVGFGAIGGAMRGSRRQVSHRAIRYRTA